MVPLIYDKKMICYVLVLAYSRVPNVTVTECILCFKLYVLILIFYLLSFIWYACHLHTQSSMNSSVDFFESLIDEDGRFAELNCQEPIQRRQRSRHRQQNIQGNQNFT